MKITRALIIREPWVSLLLDGKKDWELRSKSTAVRGTIALIASGTGTVVGVIELVDVKGPLDKLTLIFNRKHHQVSKELIESGKIDKWNTAWVMKNPHRLKAPVAYKHPPGAVIWVNLDEKTQKDLAKALSGGKAKHSKLAL